MVIYELYDGTAATGCYLSPTDCGGYDNLFRKPKINLKEAKILENALRAITTIKTLTYSLVTCNYVRKVKVVLRMLFSKSGWLPRRCRRTRKDK